MILRSATMDDADFLLRVRNDYETRAMSVDMGEILFEKHVAWLAGQLDPQRSWASSTGLYVAEDGGPIGYGRIDHIAYAACQLSYAVAPEHRGHSHGRVLVSLLVQEARRAGYETIGCKIRRGNRRSLVCAMMGGVNSIQLF